MSNITNSSLQQCTDPTAALAMIRSVPYRILDISPTLRDDPNFLLTAIQTNREVFKYLPRQWRDDSSFVLAALPKDHPEDIMYYASERLLNDETFALTALHKNQHTLYYINRTLRNQVTFALAAVRINGHALEYLPQQFYSQEDILLAAVQQSGSALL